MLYLTPDTCITWHMHDYYIITRHLVLLNSCTPVSPVSHVLLNSCTLVSPVLILMLIAQSFRRPAEHAWCQDDEDVSNDRASVRRILNGTMCHMKRSATPYTWWGPPLKSVGATSRIYSPHRAKCHTEKVPHHTRGGGHLLNLRGPPLESVGLPPVSTHTEQSAT